MFIVNVCIAIHSLLLQLWQWNNICPVKLRYFVLQFVLILILFDFCDAGTTSKILFWSYNVLFLFFLNIPVLLFDHFGLFGWVWVHCFTLYINFGSFSFFVTLGHLSLPFALKCIPFNHMHQTIYILSELPKMS